MTQHLRKLILSFVVSAFFIGAFTVQTNAQELRKVWERSARTGADEALPSWYTVGFIRGMDLHGQNLYAADRTNNQIRVLDAATGADVTLTTPYDLTGVAGGTYPMNDLAFSDDGALFLGNLTVNAIDTVNNPFRLYWWTTEGGTYTDSLTFFTEPGHRIGDKISVVGSLADNTVEVWMPAAGTTPGIIYVATTANQGTDWSIETITLSGDQTVIGTNADVVPFGIGRTSDFYVAGNSSAPARYDNTGAFITGSQLTSSSRNGLEIFEADSKTYLSVYTFRPEGVGSGSKTGMISIFDVSTAATPTLAFQTPLLGDDADTFSSIYGEGKVMVNEDGTFNVYALEGVNGFAAFTNAAAPYYGASTNKIFFSEYIEGNGSNKALEIFNNTDSTVTLANYQVAQASNGSEWKYFNSFADGATIASGGVYTAIDASFNAAIFDFELADEVLSWPHYLGFNGDDARALIHIDPVTNDTTWIDIIGEELIRPSTGWDVAGVTTATQNYTLIRKPTVTEGNSTPLGSFGTNFGDSEWIVKPLDFVANLSKPSADLFEALAGDYFVPQREGDAQGFGSLVEAFYSVSQGGLSDATTLYITGDLTETSGLKIDRDDLTESTPLTIKSADGVTATLDVVSGSGGDGIWINNADYVTIDGSNTIDGDTRDLTITSSDASLSALIYTYATMNTTIANTNLYFTGESVTVSAIVTNESGPTGTSGLSVINNTIGSENGDFQNGVGLWGTSSAYAYNSTVMNNRIHATYRGVTTWYSQGNEIVGNTVSIDSPRADRSRYAGIYAALNFGVTNISGNEIVGLKVNRSASAGYAAGILFNASLDTVVVSNNVIHVDNFENVGAATENSVYGIAFDNAAGNSYNSVYNNTVRIGTSEETGTHAAFGSHLKTSTAQFWDLKNNIFQVDQDAANANVINWPIDSNANLDADYNNYVANGASSNVGFYNTTAAVSLEEWQTASEVDDMSTDVEVFFASATDLSLTGTSDGDENLAGTPLELVTTDFSGATRSLTAPYKGAFEGTIALTGPDAPSVGEFSLINPANFASYELTGDSATVVDFTWEVAESEGDVTYMIHLDSLNGDFSEPLFSTESDSNGIKTSSAPTFADLDDMLAELGFDQGATVELKWTVTATVGDSTRFANAANTITLSRLFLVGTEDEIEKPQTFSLSQNYPNPFNPTSNIRFTLPQANNVRLDVYNINGQLVQTLVNSRMNAGEHTVQFNAGSLASGVYIYRIISGNFVQSKKMTLIK